MRHKRSRRGVFPIVLRWHEPHDPLPVRVIQARRGRKLAWFERAQAESGPVDQPFDFCTSMQRVVMDIAIRCEAFRHLQVPRILLTVTQARAGSPHGLQARVTPMRFPSGTLTRQRRGVPYHIQRYFLGEHEYLYLMTFCLPRYLDQEFDQKLVTLFHELYHISPAFDGDLRRHEGRCQYHTPRQRDYDRNMARLAREYLAMRPDPLLLGFLRMNFAQLQDRHGSVTGIVVPKPKIVPLVGPYAAASES